MSTASIPASWLPPRPSDPDPKASPGHVRHRAASALLEQVLLRPDQAERRLGAGLRGDRRLGSKDRPWVADALYGVVRRLRLLETLLGLHGWAGERETGAPWSRIRVFLDGEPLEGACGAVDRPDLVSISPGLARAGFGCRVGLGSRRPSAFLALRVFATYPDGAGGLDPLVGEERMRRHAVIVPVVSRAVSSGR